LTESSNPKRYEPPAIDLEHKNDSHTAIIELTGINKRVLEVGTSTGYTSKILKNRGNRIIGIEMDEEAGEIAKQYCESMIVGDIEELNLDDYIGPSSIDVIVLGDILEHLRRPDIILKKMKRYLTPNGYLVVSLPNICHGDILLNLLNGSFCYTPVGLLDETHIHFFAKKNISNIFSTCGYNIYDLRKMITPMGATEQKIDLRRIPLILQKFIKSLPDSNVYQFVFKAVPSNNPVNEAVSNVDFNKLFIISIREYLKERVRRVFRRKSAKHRNS
jgi:2-polyprenyl-3-methyl-5-hydroxy-6-metoxy-1,4-benzoquinol methylase